uniref:Protein kinase domain-containing protein n=1 Tax=Hyaloperonospora arabidopsidis (strain Emoy2) TaxID=559515 RepID=M4B201_HYAAE
MRRLVSATSQSGSSASRRAFARFKALQVAAEKAGLQTKSMEMETTWFFSSKSRSLQMEKVEAAAGSWKVHGSLLFVGMAAAASVGAFVWLTSESETQCEVVAEELKDKQAADNVVVLCGSCGTSSRDHHNVNSTTSTRYFDAEYEPKKVLGRGSFGIVMQCLHKQTGRVAAVKMLQKSAGNEEEIEREKQALERLEKAGGHASLVGYMGAYFHNDFHYIVLEYVPGISLHSFMEKHHTLDATWSLQLVSQLASALQFMHEADVVHRDLKPENIMAIGDRGGTESLSGQQQNEDVMLKIIDLGSAGRGSQPESIDKPRTTNLSGTRCYWSPEVLQCQDMTTAMDMWALGCILYILLSGRHPFDLTGSSTEDEILHRVKTEPVSFLTPVWHSVSVEIKDLIRGLLEKDPRRRFSAAQVLDHLSLLRGTTKANP